MIIKVEEEEEESWLSLKGEREKLLLNSPPQGKETSLGAASGEEWVRICLSAYLNTLV